MKSAYGAVLAAALFCASASSFATTFASDVHAEPVSSGPDVLPLPMKAFRLVTRESGPVDYYAYVDDAAMPYIQARYHAPYRTAIYGIQTPDADRGRARRLRWQWRAVALPNGGNECADSDKHDSAAVIYATWKRGLRYYTLKYVWSSVGPRGWTCDRKRNPFSAQDTVILETGGPLGQWKSEDIDLHADFRRHFEDNDPNAEIPDFMGVAIMSDGDQTHTDSAADYAAFSIVR